MSGIKDEVFVFTVIYCHFPGTDLKILLAFSNAEQQKKNTCIFLVFHEYFLLLFPSTKLAPKWPTGLSQLGTQFFKLCLAYKSTGVFVCVCCQENHNRVWQSLFLNTRKHVHIVYMIMSYFEAEFPFYTFTSRSANLQQDLGNGPHLSVSDFVFFTAVYDLL